MYLKKNLNNILLLKKLFLNKIKFINNKKNIFLIKNKLKN